MATIKGKQGKLAVRIGDATQSTYLAKITNWSFSGSKDTEDTSYFGGSATEEGYIEKIPGILDWTMSGEGAIDDGADSATFALWDAMKQDTVVEMTLYLTANKAIVGSGVLSSFEVEDSADGNPTVSFEMAGSGEADIIDVVTGTSISVGGGDTPAVQSTKAPAATGGDSDKK